MKKYILLLSIFFMAFHVEHLHAQKIQYTTYIVKEGESIRGIAKKVGCRVRDIKNLNPDVAKYPAKNTTLIVPVTDTYWGQSLMKKNKKDTRKDKHEPKRKLHKVKKGDTFYSLAHKYHVTIQSIKKLNPQTQNGLFEGQTLVIPDRSDFTVDPDEGPDNLTLYEVKKGDTKWSISQAHGITIEELEKYNPTIKEGLKEGAKIWVPVEEQESNGTEYIPGAIIYHKVKPDDTLIKIAAMYGVSIEEIRKLNPEATKMMRPYMMLKIPAKKKDNFLVHTVEKGETLYSLSRFFDVSIEELKERNDGLPEGLKEGMELRIKPVIYDQNVSVSVSVSITYTPDTPDTGKSYVTFPNDSTRFEYPVKLSFLLPLMGEKEELLTGKQKKIRDISTSFYMGAELALDTLRKAGFLVESHVFDTENNLMNLAEIIRHPLFQASQVSIGPFFFDKAQALADRTGEKPVIPPFYSKKQETDHHTNIIKSSGDKDLLLKRLSQHLLRNKDKKTKYIIISDQKEEHKNTARRLGDLLKAGDSLVNLQYIYPSHNKKDESLIFMDKKKLESSVIEGKSHRVILVSDENIVISDVINTYGVLSLHEDVQLFTIKAFKDESSLDYNHLANLHWTFVSDHFTDLNTEANRVFRRKFYERNHLFPDDKAYKGYDLTLDIVQRLAAYDDWEEALRAGRSSRIAHTYEYIKSPFGDYRNDAIRLVRFTADMEYRILDEIAPVEKTAPEDEKNK